MANGLIKQVKAILPGPRSLLAFVGAGGKSTCIYQLARLLIDEGANVLITTTTKLYHPAYEQREDWRLQLGSLLQADMDEPNRKGKIDIAALAEITSLNKLTGFPPREIEEVLTFGKYDYILVEADGSKQKPIKAPAEHEPVIPDATALVIGFVGLDCLGRPLDESTAHRANLLSNLVKQPPNSKISEITIKNLILAKEGLFKGTPGSSGTAVVLNKADTKDLVEQGTVVKQAVLQATNSSVPIDQILVGALKR